MTTLLRDIIKRFHPEGIPWPGSVIYNALSSTYVFYRHYELVARDITQYVQKGSILDIGTGPAHLLAALHKKIPEAKIVGVDISSSMIAKAKQNLKIYGESSLIEVKIADANALPFKDNTFDCIVSTGSLHHWKDPVRSLSEAYRVLKTDGHALIYDLIQKMPGDLRKGIRDQFGSFRLALIWLHSLLEPFLNAEEMEAVGRKTAFIVEGTRFTGALCCLVLRK